MIKKCFGLFLSVLCVLSFFSHGVFAESLQSPTQELVTANQIMITNHGIMVNINNQGLMLQTNSIVHVGNGIYQITSEYYGSCRRCGWPLDQNEKCTNQNCNQYGPKERD